MWDKSKSAAKLLYKDNSVINHLKSVQLNKRIKMINYEILL